MTAKEENVASPAATPNAPETQSEWVYTLKRIAGFFALIAVLLFGLNAMITSGLRRVKTGEYGVSNQLMEGKVNAQILITGSSRAVAHYDPRIIQAATGRTAFNAGRNGSQTDMQLAVFRAYLEHNRNPELVIHNLDAFTFVTTREVYNSAQYVPYLYDEALYQPLQKINPNTWKSRYLPMYGYVVDDMNFSWMQGVKGFFGWSPPQDVYAGFAPREATWTDDFANFKAGNPGGVSWGIEPAGIQLVKDLIALCEERRIPLMFVYSPEYAEMENLTKNRAEIFGIFHDLTVRHGIPLWDYSQWNYAGDTRYFVNSQHLNAAGATAFSNDLAERLHKYFAGQPGAMANRPQ